MGKTIVTYKSIYGNTKRYAQWIAEELNCDIVDISSKPKLSDYDTIIFGGGLYSGKIEGAKELLKQYDTIKDKKLVVFGVGLSDPDGIRDEYRILYEKSFNEEVRDNFTLFALRGGIDYDKLNLKHSVSMKMFMKILEKKRATLEPANLEILNNFGQTVDHCSKETIKDLVEFVR